MEQAEITRIGNALIAAAKEEIAASVTGAEVDAILNFLPADAADLTSGEHMPLGWVAAKIIAEAEAAGLEIPSQVEDRQRDASRRRVREERAAGIRPPIQPAWDEN